jgi:hypothetical protein
MSTTTATVRGLRDAELAAAAGVAPYTIRYYASGVAARTGA